MKKRFFRNINMCMAAVCIVLCVLTAGCSLFEPKPCEHSYRSSITAEATCTQEGVETFTCEQCEDSYTKPIPMTDHNYNNGVVVVEPSCIQEGTEEFTCTGCGITRTETLKITHHTAGEITVTKEPNCTAMGTKTTTCTVCQLFYVVEVLETDIIHDMQETVLKEATCLEEGEGFWTCSRCGFTEEGTYEKLEHNYQELHVAPATCMFPEGHMIGCTAGCGQYYYEWKGPRAEHDWEVVVMYNALYLKCKGGCGQYVKVG